MRTAKTVILVVVATLAVAGCGSASKTHTAPEASSAAEDATAPKSPEGTKAPAYYAACPKARGDYEVSQEMVETGRELGSKSIIRNGEEAVESSRKMCAAEREDERMEAKICKNSPAEVSEALAIEDTPANEEYVGVYEATCGRHVPRR